MQCLCLFQQTLTVIPLTMRVYCNEEIYVKPRSTSSSKDRCISQSGSQQHAQATPDSSQTRSQTSRDAHQAPCCNLAGTRFNRNRCDLCARVAEANCRCRPVPLEGTGVSPDVAALLNRRGNYAAPVPRPAITPQTADEFAGVLKDPMQEYGQQLPRPNAKP